MKIANRTNFIPNNTNIISLPAGRQVVISDLPAICLSWK